MLSWDCPGNDKEWGRSRGKMWRRKRIWSILSLLMLPPRGWGKWGSIQLLLCWGSFGLLILSQRSTANAMIYYIPKYFFWKKYSSASCSPSFICVVVGFYLDVESHPISDWIMSCFSKSHLQLVRILILIISSSRPVAPPNPVLLGNLISMFSSSLSILLMRILNNSELRNKWSFI